MYRSPEQETIARKSIKLSDKREVHIRVAGAGPPILLLHQSPTSSAELVSVVERFAASGFLAIAPDTPGFGLSDPLPLGPPVIGRFADSLKELVDVLGIKKCGVYGFHTGAMIAAEFSRRYADIVGAAILDGYVVMEPDVVADILNHYFKTPTITWDGGHMAWLWARIRDQGYFFPWYAKRPDSLFASTSPDADEIHHRFLDFLRTNLEDSTAYRAAFLFDSVQIVKEFTVPTFLLNYRADAISDHPEKLSALATCVKRERFETHGQLFERSAEIFSECLKNADEFGVETILSINTSTKNHFVKTEFGWLRARIVGEGDPVLVLHDVAQSVDALEPLEAELSINFKVISIDLPGHGESLGANIDPAKFEELVGAIEQAVRSMNYTIKNVVGVGAGGVIAAKIASRELVGCPDRAVVIDPWFFGKQSIDQYRSKFAPHAPPSLDGSHALSAWHQAREKELFRPWYLPGPNTVVHRSDDYDINWIQRRAIDILKAGGAAKKLTEAALLSEISQTMNSLGSNLTVLCIEGPDLNESIQHVTDAAPAANVCPTAFSPKLYARQVRYCLSA